ncbi:MAG: MFS transporter [Alphaproteobacteria bacterium]|nr:MFS transporter [Alphaproteobacteria bacterium]
MHIWRNIALLAACHAVLITMFSALVSLSAITSLELAPRPSLATLPFGCLTLTQLALCFFASQWMGKVGRRKGFSTGAIAGIIGAVILAIALAQQNFTLFCIGHALSGAAAAFGIYYRFAAVENAPPEMNNRAVSLVLAGGVIAAVIGPTLASTGRHILPAQFVGTAIALAILWTLALIATRFLSEATPNVTKNPDGHNDPAARGRLSRLLSNRTQRSAAFIIAAVCGAVAYGVMNLVMLATPLAMQENNFNFPLIARTIQLHVLAMYVPSFFTGSLIDRFGLRTIMWAGIVILVAASATHFIPMPPDLRFPAGLIALGLGWNFLFVSASALVAKLGEPHERPRLQGINEFVILLAITCTAFASGWSFNAIGWAGLNLIVLLPLALTAVLLLFFTRRRLAAAA